MRDLETGTDARIEIECSETTRTEFKRMLASIDPDMTYEELLIATIRVYDEYPQRFEKHRY